VDIRTKLVFYFVAVSIATMAGLGWWMYRVAEQDLQNASVEQLTSLARFKVDALEGILGAWHDRVTLVSSRTQLRESLNTFNRTGDEAARLRMSGILQDALGASTTLYQLWVYDPDGQLVVAVGPDTEAGAPEPDVLSNEVGPTNSGYGGVTFRADAPPVVSLYARMILRDEVIGYLYAVLDTEEVEDLSLNYEGLGLTGETMVVALDRNGDVRVLHQVRNAPVGIFGEAGERLDAVGLRPGLELAPESTGGLAARGEEKVYLGNVTDYRGARVRAVTRFVPATRWGVVVKVDEVEDRVPIDAFRATTIRLVLSLGAFAILGGLLLGFRFTQPILTLAAAAEKLGDGHLGTRTGIQQEDEVGLLARTFDEMAEDLEDKIQLLDEFRFFFDVSIDMLCIASTDGYFKRINEAFTRELGWSEEELLERPFLDMVHAEDVDATLKEVEKLAGGTPTIRFDNRFECADGSYKWLRWNSFPDPRTGRLYAIARAIDPPLAHSS